MNTKTLTVNGIIMARYENQGSSLWLRPMVYLQGVPQQVSEDILVLLITEVEKTRFSKIGALMKIEDTKKN
jgi:hypothetical protein